MKSIHARPRRIAVSPVLAEGCCKEPATAEWCKSESESLDGDTEMLYTLPSL